MNLILEGPHNERIIGASLACLHVFSMCHTFFAIGGTGKETLVRPV